METKNFFQLPPSLQPFGHQTNVFEDRIWQGSSKVLVRQSTLLVSTYGKSQFYEETKEQKQTQSYEESDEEILTKTLKGEGTEKDRENTRKYLDSTETFKISPKLSFGYFSSSAKKEEATARFAPVHIVVMFKDEKELIKVIIDIKPRKYV